MYLKLSLVKRLCKIMEDKFAYEYFDYFDFHCYKVENIPLLTQCNNAVQSISNVIIANTHHANVPKIPFQRFIVKSTLNQKRSSSFSMKNMENSVVINVNKNLHEKSIVSQHEYLCDFQMKSYEKLSRIPIFPTHRLFSIEEADLKYKNNVNHLKSILQRSFNEICTEKHFNLEYYEFAPIEKCQMIVPNSKYQNTAFSLLNYSQANQHFPSNFYSVDFKFNNDNEESISISLNEKETYSREGMNIDEFMNICSTNHTNFVAQEKPLLVLDETNVESESVKMENKCVQDTNKNSHSKSISIAIAAESIPKILFRFRLFSINLPIPKGTILIYGKKCSFLLISHSKWQTLSIELITDAYVKFLHWKSCKSVIIITEAEYFLVDEKYLQLLLSHEIQILVSYNENSLCEIIERNSERDVMHYSHHDVPFENSLNELPFLNPIVTKYFVQKYFLQSNSLKILKMKNSLLKETRIFSSQQLLLINKIL